MTDEWQSIAAATSIARIPAASRSARKRAPLTAMPHSKAHRAKKSYISTPLSELQFWYCLAMGERKSKPVSEETYRKLVWRQVEDELGRTQQSKADLATLGNLDSLAAALDMELGAFVWPLVQPNDAAGAARKAEAQSLRLQVATFNNLQRKFLDALNHDTAQRVLRVVGRLGMTAPGDLLLFAEAMEALMERREAANTQGEPT